MVNSIHALFRKTCGLSRAHNSQSHLARRPVLRFETLETRLQPNDMLGLGLSLLGMGSVWDFGETAEARPAAVQEQEITPVSVVAERTPAEQTSILLDRATPDAQPIPAVAKVGASEELFQVVSSQGAVHGLFSLEDQPAPSRTLILAAERLADVRANVQGFLIAPAMQVVGLQGHVLPKPLAATPLWDAGRLLTLMLASQKTQQGSGAGIRGPMVTLTDGPVSVTLDSYGRSQDFSVGASDVLFEHHDYFPEDRVGPLKRVNDVNCVIDFPITPVTPPFDAFSIITCGGYLQLLYYHVAWDFGTVPPSGMWLTYIQPLLDQPGCFYSYTDYDVLGSPGDTGFRTPGSFGQTDFQVRDGFAPPVYLFSDVMYSGPIATHWEQGPFDALRTNLDLAGGCINLANAPSSFGPGDWTGALQWPVVLPDFGYAHWRYDFFPLP